MINSDAAAAKESSDSLGQLFNHSATELTVKMFCRWIQNEWCRKSEIIRIKSELIFALPSISNERNVSNFLRLASNTKHFDCFSHRVNKQHLLNEFFARIAFVIASCSPTHHPDDSCDYSVKWKTHYRMCDEKWFRREYECGSWIFIPKLQQIFKFMAWEREKMLMEKAFREYFFSSARHIFCHSQHIQRNTTMT